MGTKSIASTQAQNNFGQILDDVIQNGTRYVIKRRSAPVAIVMSLTEFDRVLNSDKEREKVSIVVREMSPTYDIGELLEEDKKR